MFGNPASKIEKLIAKKNDAQLAQLAQHKDEAVRLAAIAGLGKVGGEAGFNTLVALLRSPDAKTRAAVAKAAGELKDSKLRAHIEHLLKSEKDAQVIAALHEALGKIAIKD